mgnify:CR=1 FL=1
MDPMTSYEQLARRYCALIGEDADDRIDGVPVWRIAMADLEAAIREQFARLTADSPNATRSESFRAYACG